MTVGNIQFGENTAESIHCPYCGQWHFGAHMCTGTFHAAPAYQPYLVTPMTAEQFRQILREELEHHRNELDKAQR